MSVGYEEQTQVTVPEAARVEAIAGGRPITFTQSADGSRRLACDSKTGAVYGWGETDEQALEASLLQLDRAQLQESAETGISANVIAKEGTPAPAPLVFSESLSGDVHYAYIGAVIVGHGATAEEARADARRRLASTGAEMPCGAEVGAHECHRKGCEFPLCAWKAPQPSPAQVEGAKFECSICGGSADWDGPEPTCPDHGRTIVAADFPEMPVPQHHTSGYMRVEGEKGAVTPWTATIQVNEQANSYFLVCDDIAVAEVFGKSEDSRRIAYTLSNATLIPTMQVNAADNYAASESRLHKAEADGERLAEGLTDRVALWKQRADNAEAARDAYKAALVDAQFFLMHEQEITQRRLAYAVDHTERGVWSSKLEDIGVLRGKIRAALSRGSTADSPAIADSSRDDVGAGKEADRG